MISGCILLVVNLKSNTLQQPCVLECGYGGDRLHTRSNNRDTKITFKTRLRVEGSTGCAISCEQIQEIFLVLGVGRRGGYDGG